jgi:hypothetical protein
LATPKGQTLDEYFIIIITQVEEKMNTKGIKEEELEELLAQHKSFFVDPRELTPQRNHEHNILLQFGTSPVSVKPYRCLFYQKTKIEEQVKDMIGRGIIHPSNSPYSSPILLVKKNDGTWRMCVDYRELNKITVKDKFLIPVIDELLDELHGARFFTKLDLRFRYHQVHVAKKDIEKTAFRTHPGHYKFLVMPFGSTNAPSTFQSHMNVVFHDFLHKHVLGFFFFNNILVYSQDWAQHMKHVGSVLEILGRQQLC